MLEKYSFADEDFEDTGFGAGMMRRFITAKDLSLRAGFWKLRPGEISEDTYWIHEFLYVRSGKGKYYCEGNKWNPESKEFEARTGDVIYIQKGTKWKVECISDEAHVLFYVAIPASAQGLGYEMLPQTKGKPI